MIRAEGDGGVDRRGDDSGRRDRLSGGSSGERVSPPPSSPVQSGY